MSLPPHEQDVVDVLEASHRAFWLKDADAFRRHNLAKNFCFRWMYWQPGGVTIRNGWDQIGQPSLQHIERLVRPLPEFAEAPMANLRLRVGTEMAWASFDRTFPHLPEIFGQGPNGVLHNVTILERHDGAWKIVGQCLYDAHLGDDTLVEVDTDGRIIWASEPASARLADDEIFVVRVGRREFGWVPWDALGKIHTLHNPDAEHQEAILKIVDAERIRERHFGVVLDACHGSGG